MTLRSTSLVALTVMTISLTPAVTTAQDDPKNNKAAASDDPMGYFLGVSVGQRMMQDGFEPGDFKPAALAAGVVDALAERDLALSDEQLQEVRGRIEGLLRKRRQVLMAEMEKEAALNKEKGELWLKQNGEKEGVKSLEGGLQYKVIKSGKGASPSAADTVKVHYTGTLITGKVFDSSVKAGKPLELSLGRVIEGWQIALQKMKVGDKWMLYIPPELGYGEDGRPGAIGPNEVLVFEIELLDII